MDLDILVLAAEAGVAGALAMSIMQIVKELFSLRTGFHERRFRAWLLGDLAKLGGVEGKIEALSCGCDPPTVLWACAQRGDRQISCGACQQPFAPSQETPSYEAVTRGIFEIICNGDAGLLFAQTSPEMIASLLSAARYAIAFPTEHRPLLLALGVRRGDIAALVEIEGMGSSLDHNVQMQVKRRATMAVTASIEAFRRQLEGRWKAWHRGLGLAISAAVLLWWWFPSFALDGGPHNIVTWVLCAVAGGLLAPVSKDLVKVIEGLRRRESP